MANFRALFRWTGVLQRADRGRELRLPEPGKARLPLEMMSKHSLNSDYLGDLRVSGRDGGLGRRRR